MLHKKYSTNHLNLINILNNESESFQKLALNQLQLEKSSIIGIQYYIQWKLGVSLWVSTFGIIFYLFLFLPSYIKVKTIKGSCFYRHIQVLPQISNFQNFSFRTCWEVWPAYLFLHAKKKMLHFVNHMTVSIRIQTCDKMIQVFFVPLESITSAQVTDWIHCRHMRIMFWESYSGPSEYFTYLTHSWHPDLIRIFHLHMTGAILKVHGQHSSLLWSRTLPLGQSENGQGRSDETKGSSLEDW